MRLDESPGQPAAATASDSPPPRDRGRRGRRRSARQNPDEAQGQQGASQAAPERPRLSVGRTSEARRRGRGQSPPPAPPPVRCARATVTVPTAWPVASREGLATALLIEVDRRGDERLVCDGLHDGPHFWPDVEPSPPIWDAELDASLANPDGIEDDSAQPSVHVPAGHQGPAEPAIGEDA